MTKSEANKIKNWNCDITRVETRTRDAAEKIEDKYMDLNGHRACSPAVFLHEIASSTQLDIEERIQDIGAYIEYLRARAKKDALIDLLALGI